MDTIAQDFDFDTLVPGEENILAISGALRALEEPGERYNPLYIFGPPSVGKSHLLYALRRRFEISKPDWNILALPAGEFLEECEQAWHHNTSVEFRQHLWSVDVLLIDDVHLLANRPAPLEELYHAFNRLVADSRQLVLSSRFSPAEMNDFPVTLKSRFQSGLVVGIEPPREQMMRDIVERKCSETSLRLSRKALDFLCREVRNVREVQGVLNELTQRGSGKRISLSEIREVLSRHSTQKISIADVAKTVCQYFHVELSRVRSASRQQSLVQARQMAMYLTREMTAAALTEIGGYFGGRDHTTVLYACRKMGEELRQNSYSARAAREIRTMLRG